MYKCYNVSDAFAGNIWQRIVSSFNRNLTILFLIGDYCEHIKCKLQNHLYSIFSLYI